MVIPLGDVERSGIVPVITYVLIGVNTALYVVQIAQGPSFTVAYAATPWEITHNVDLPAVSTVLPPDLGPDEVPPELAPLIVLQQQGIEQASIAIPVWLTLLTSMFLHGSPLHLAGNMLYLWIFGDNVEEVLGGGRYLIAYLTCGLVGSLFQILSTPNSLIPTLGASGAIAGVMGMYLVWFPRHRIRLLLIRVIVEVQAIWVISFWILLQVLRGVNSIGELGQSGGVAYLAHVGGAATGLAIGFGMRGRASSFRRRRPWYETEPY